MIIEHIPAKFVIRRGNRYFSFFVDHDGTSWSNRQSNARTFVSEDDAREVVSDINRREAIRKESYRKAPVKT